ncbi:hypothetical protein JAAARDRAFT_704997 [Jaapia argillacea MUCL 33604]|uniref:3'-5' exonuclease domain-containing protein n=1 Tax=Jaapia argillacea MUCL 33604 TaxID=933084 RepID=A0A067Q3N6_9AGAM|nr:hypothetical protein JAAARDRAFT_704997 [Jaapia argillacea MUCL 33604]
MDNYKFCDTSAALKDAIDDLKVKSHIAFDCEGINLGQSGGHLSLVTLADASSASSTIYVLDILALDASALQPLFSLLGSKTSIKIVFDGRMDFSELFHRYNVELATVLDLQLVDVQSRVVRGEGMEK